MKSPVPIPTIELELLADLAREAGAAILGYFRQDVTIDRKDDHSPVTDADRAADAILAAGLRKLTPDIPVITEEEVADGIAPTDVGSRFWLVDPLDGTREFIHGRDEFTVVLNHCRQVLFCVGQAVEVVNQQPGLAVVKITPGKIQVANITEPNQFPHRHPGRNLQGAQAPL